MKLRLDTVILFVQNVNRLRQFYTATLQLEVVEDMSPGWVLLKAGSANIGLHKIGSNYLKDTTGEFKSDSNTKIVFEVDTDLAGIRERLMNENVPMKEIKTFENYDYWVCDGEDPEGNVFQLKQRKNTP